MPTRDIDEKWMRRALRLAEKGRGKVHPNPMVGAVLVRGGRVVGEGCHRQFGAAHAEVEALKRANERGSKGARGATLYVNLEPCSHWGKTPPCAEAILRAGITRVVAAMKDPNPLVSGRGFRRLRRAGVSITQGVLEGEARYLNRAFITRMKHGRPYVTLKVASSLDGRTATITGESKWITSEQSRKAGYRLRGEADAIAVGAGTILKDNPSLTTHGLGGNPVRILFAGRRRLPKNSHVFDSAAPTWVLRGTQGKIKLRKALSDLSRRGITHLLVEGGLTLQRSFLEAGLVDEVIWFIAPMIIGNAKRLKDAWRLKGATYEAIGPDLCVRAVIHNA